MSASNFCFCKEHQPKRYTRGFFTQEVFYEWYCKTCHKYKEPCGECRAKGELPAESHWSITKGCEVTTKYKKCPACGGSGHK